MFATYLILFSIGVFSLALSYYGTRAIFSPGRFFFTLISLTFLCLLFSVVQIIHLRLPFDFNRILAVQLSYASILIVQPLFLLVLRNSKSWMRLILRVLLGVNLFVFTVVVFLLLFHRVLPFSINESFLLANAPFHRVIGIVGTFNWILVLVWSVVSLTRESHKSFSFYPLVGYVLLSLTSLFDIHVFSMLVAGKTLIVDFYPGLIIGFILLHVAMLLSFSRSYSDREKETESSVKAMQESKKELMRMAYYDDTTSRPNRKSFLLHLNHHLIETMSLEKNKAVFLIDLDNFRDINDTFGYDFGDLVIKNVGDKIENRFGVRDRLYRLYGDEFAIIWDDVRDRGQVIDLAHKILNDLTSLVEIDDATLYLGVSLGAVFLPEDGSDVSEALRHCESALAEAKKDKNTFFFYNTELESRTRRKMNIVHSLREALKTGQFTMVYQPIVFSDGALVELEALIRCSHPSLAETSPDVFISVAESSGLIIPLTWWILDRVSKDVVKLAKDRNAIRIYINMSAKILKSKDLVKRIVDLEHRHMVSGANLGFEITESAIIENIDQVQRNLRDLRDRGYKISLDDFGTGYSSLSYIKNLPLDKLKIDQRFVSGISVDSRDEALINSIISIAENLGLDLVAEGVELPNQLAYLNQRGCVFFQGFLFSKPLPLQDIQKLV